MTLEQLMQVSANARDERWEDQFLQALTESSIAPLSPDPQTGHDGWPYLLVQTAPVGEPAQKILEWLGTRGIGLAVNPQKDYPDFVLSWGMIWNFRETGRFLHRGIPEGQPSTGGSLDLGKLAHAGTPTPQYLPDYVRKILREFFRDQGLHDVRILVVSEDRKNYDLAFSLESLGNPPESEWAGVGEAISWFLPAHYSILLVSEKGLPGFSSL